MTLMSDRLGQYLNHRRRLGHRSEGTMAAVLRRFAAFADDMGAECITTGLFLEWRRQFEAPTDVTWGCNLSHVRGFAKWLHCVDPRTEVPPAGLIRRGHRRPRPYIYTEEELARIVEHAAQLPSRRGLNAWTFSTLFGLIAVTGLRLGEALGLDEADVDLDEAVLTITRTKNDEFRLLPFAPSTGERLDAYRTVRDRTLGSGAQSFFLDEQGRRPSQNHVQAVFARVGVAIGVRDGCPAGKRGRGPRIHDLRHTMAVRTITAWYRQGLDPNREMIKLTTYLGHKHPSHTYWYMEAVPELMRLACARAEQAADTGGMS
ncbi:MAG: tyrosine-type recombinase/integrase [Gammaproteobacteria bacterium]|nr:tyrosine-type recombinase/integrase [Gammaproteobacteria bacterium]